MFEAKVTNEKTYISINGSLPQIMTDLTNIISNINENLEKNGVGHDFRVMFTKGFMDGVLFGDNECRESMERYLLEGDEATDNKSIKKSKEELVTLMKELLDMCNGGSDEAE